MAVYIKQSPPREGVRGGWEDFKWDSLKSQSAGERDYYLGASLKVGIHSRGGKFEKHDWWTKRRETGSEPNDKAEVVKIRSFEEQLMKEALGTAPKRLLQGTAAALEENENDGANEAISHNHRSDTSETATLSRKLKKEKKEKRRKRKSGKPSNKKDKRKHSRHRKKLER